MAAAFKIVALVDGGRTFSLRLAGVSRIRIGPLNAYEKNTCRPGASCRCVALIHGLGDSALTWDKVLRGAGGAPEVPAGWRLVALELPGTEGSDAPATPGGYAVPAMAETVDGALRGRCPEWTLVGNSLGGWVAAWAALQWPQGVRRLVLVNPAGFTDPSGVAEKTARLLEGPTGPALKEFSARAYHKAPWAPPWAWEAAAATIRARPAARMVAALRLEDLLDGRAKGIRAETTIVWGESDRVMPRAVGEAYAREIPGARLLSAPECGHLPQQECPAAVSRALYNH